MQGLSWTDQAIYEWAQSGTKIQTGASPDKILETEIQIDFKFPPDFKDLYNRVNGFEDLDWNEHMFSFWSLDRIVDEYKAGDDADFIGFCDFLINSYSIGFSKTNKKIFKHFDSVNPICDSFQEVVLLINSGSGNIY